ncbi:MAG: hypothetical protein ACPGFB_15805 [Verrucomicrobiales bacterium]
MKHIITASVLALASCLPSAAADEGIDELCRELLDSIAADDPVAYAHCYTTIRHSRGQMSLLDASDEDRQRLLGKLRDRNTTIRQSFRIMREQIAGPGAKIEFTSAEAKVETETFRGVRSTGTSQILCRFRANSEEWVLDLDDGILLDGQWFLSDDPSSLENRFQRIDFRPSGKDKEGNIIYGRVIEKNPPNSP